MAETEFPPPRAFYSNLTGESVDTVAYHTAKNHFYRCKDLAEDNPEKMRNMADWLRYYNLLDVSPLVVAMDRSFDCFHRYFQLDATLYLSLPKIALESVMRLYDQSCSYIFTFGNDWNHIRQAHREHVNGGCVGVYHRDINILDASGPPTARFAPNGDPYSYLVQIDFNALYAFCQMQPMPTTPGVLWKWNGRIFTKSVMCNSNSLVATQWMFYLEATHPAIKREGRTLHHFFHQKEARLAGDLVDGYIPCTAGRRDGHVFEFNGCLFHGCCKHAATGAEKRQKFDAKCARLQAFGEVTVMRECEWARILPTVQFTKTRFPRILFRMDSLQALLQGIRTGELYGFLRCDITGPDELIEELAEINFPPVFNKVHLTDEHLSDYMKIRYNDRSKKLDQTSLIQTFHAKNQVIHTCLAKFYLDMGLKLVNIEWFSQYIGAPAIKPFVEKVVQMRIQAQKDSTKANTAKIIGNSGILLYFCLKLIVFSLWEISRKCRKAYQN